jgi:hypothetical protein
MEDYGTIYYFRKYIEDENYPVPDDYMQQVQDIIEFLKTRNELRCVAAKRLGVTENNLIKMINYWNNHKKYTVKVSHNTVK